MNELMSSDNRMNTSFTEREILWSGEELLSDVRVTTVAANELNISSLIRSRRERYAIFPVYSSTVFNQLHSTNDLILLCTSYNNLYRVLDQLVFSINTIKIYRTKSSARIECIRDLTVRPKTSHHCWYLIGSFTHIEYILEGLLVNFGLIIDSIKINIFILTTPAMSPSNSPALSSGFSLGIRKAPIKAALNRMIKTLRLFILVFVINRLDYCLFRLLLCFSDISIFKPGLFIWEILWSTCFTVPDVMM